MHAIIIYFHNNVFLDRIAKISQRGIFICIYFYNNPNIWSSMIHKLEVPTTNCLETIISLLGGHIEQKNSFQKTNSYKNESPFQYFVIRHVLLSTFPKTKKIHLLHTIKIVLRFISEDKPKNYFHNIFFSDLIFLCAFL